MEKGGNGSYIPIVFYIGCIIGSIVILTIFSKWVGLKTQLLLSHFVYFTFLTLLLLIPSNRGILVWVVCGIGVGIGG